MSNLRRALRAAARFTIALGAGFLACVAQADADTFEARFLVPYPTLQIVPAQSHLVSLTPFEIPQDAPAQSPSQPFGAELSGLVKGGLQRKWSAVKRKLPREHAILMRCEARPAART